LFIYTNLLTIEEVEKMRKVLSIILILLFLCSVGVASAATLQVGPTAKYKTIQSAVNAAKSGDTINVASGTYKETVVLKDGRITLRGYNYPKVYGFQLSSGKCANIIGFGITKTGIDDSYSGGQNTFRNNKFENCGISIAGHLSNGDTITTCSFNKGGIILFDTLDQTITNNYIYGAKNGLNIMDSVDVKTVTGNTFKSCNIAVLSESVPDMIKTKFSGNKYISNKVNFKFVSI
jgi:nitrous oxidase accessory protein NosD